MWDVCQQPNLESSLCDCSDSYMLVKWTITVPNTADEGQLVNNNDT